MTSLIPAKVLLRAADIPVISERERVFISELEKLAAHKETATTREVLADLDEEMYGKLAANIPKDIADRVHVFPYESNRRLRMSQLIQPLRSPTTESADFRDLTGQIYRLLFEYVFDERYHREPGVPMGVDTRVNEPTQQRSVQLVPRMSDVEKPVLAVFMRAGLYPALVLGKEFERATGQVPEYALFRIRRDGHKGREALKYVLDYEFNGEAMRGRDVYIPEPMLATAGSLLAVHQHVTRAGITPKSLTLLGTIGAYEGTVLAARHIPGLEVYLAWMDPLLNKKGYILPGLGDAGDLLNGQTEELGLLLRSYSAEFCKVHEKQIESLYHAMGSHAPKELFQDLDYAISRVEATALKPHTRHSDL